MISLQLLRCIMFLSKEWCESQKCLIYRENSNSVHTLTCAVVWCCLVCISDEIESVMAYKGSIFGCCIVYIFPAGMYVKLRARKLEVEKRRKARRSLEAVKEEEAVATLNGKDLAHTANGSSISSLRAPMLSHTERAVAHDDDDDDEGSDSSPTLTVDACYSLDVDAPMGSPHFNIDSGGEFSMNSDSGGARQHTSDQQANMVTRAWRSLTGSESYAHAGGAGAAPEADPAPVHHSRHQHMHVDASASDASFDRTGSHAYSASQAAHAHLSGGPPSSWITLDSPGVSIVVWVLFAWGIGLGCMGLVINIIAQSGGLPQCV